MSRFDLHSLDALGAILAEAGRREVMPRFRRLAESDVRAKTGPLDLVTEADEAAERLITAELHARFPGCVVVGEEAASAEPGILGRLADAELAFVVDPIDGTANFASGLPLFGVMAAVVARGEIIGALIHDPVGLDATAALRGQGAWTVNSDGVTADLRVAAPVPLEEMAGAASWRFLPPAQRDAVQANLHKVAATFQYRCAAHEYRLAAGGHCHYLLYGKLMPWDHAPGWLLHREAGGYSARFDGSEYGVTTLAGGLIAAPDRESWQALREGLLGGV